MKVQIRPRGPASTKLRFSPGLQGPGTEWQVNTATGRFEYRSTGSSGAWTEAPGSGFAGLVGSLTAEQITVTQPGTGGVPRSLTARAKDRVSVKDYGAKGDNTGDDAVAIMRADAAVVAMGGGEVYFPAGLYPIGSDIAPSSNVTWRGAGGGASILKVPDGNTARNSAIRYVPASDEGRQNIILEGLGFQGQWGAVKSEVSAGGAVTLKFVKNLTIRNCHVLNSRYMGFNINECDHVRVDGCLLEYCTRDFIAVWGTPHVRITNNTMRHNDDDGISVNYETTGKNPIRSETIISHNFLEDCGGIRTEVPKNVIVSHNVGRRQRGQGILIGVTNVSGNDLQGGHGILVTDNVITDVLDRGWNSNTVQGSNGRVYILIQSMPTMAGDLAVAAGEVNPATGKVQSPYEWNYTRASRSPVSGSIRATHGIVVSGNICMRTLPAVTAYSDWGYGPGYNKTGMVDYAVPETLMRAPGCRLTLPLTDVTVEGNHFETGRYGLFFDVATGVTLASNLAKGVMIRGNRFKDFDTYGINWVGATLTHQDITIEGNTFDGDPYFQSTSRGAGGSWANNTGLVGLFVGYLAGLVVSRNTFSNVAAIMSQVSVSALQDHFDNKIVCDPAAIGYSTSNKGVGDIPAIGDGAQWWIIPKDCDPTSATYGNSLGTTPRNAASLPTSGKWLPGMIVTARGTGIDAATSKLLMEHRRLTAGTSNVVGTDWRPVYGTTTI